MNKNSPRFCHGRKISRHWTDLKATGSYWSSNRRCFNMKPTPSIWCSTVHSLFLTHREKTAGSKTGERGHFWSWVPNGISSSQFGFIHWRMMRRRAGGRVVVEWSMGVGRRGRGKRDLLTATTTHSKRNSKRTDGMREAWRRNRTEREEEKGREMRGKGDWKGGEEERETLVMSCH